MMMKKKTKRTNARICVLVTTRRALSIVLIHPRLLLHRLSNSIINNNTSRSSSNHNINHTNINNINVILPKKQR